MWRITTSQRGEKQGHRGRELGASGACGPRRPLGSAPPCLVPAPLGFTAAVTGADAPPCAGLPSPTHRQHFLGGSAPMGVVLARSVFTTTPVMATRTLEKVGRRRADGGGG